MRWPVIHEVEAATGGQTGPMSAPTLAELSSVTATVESVRQRLAGFAQRAPAGHEDLLAALYEGERALKSAERHLERAQRLMT